MVGLEAARAKASDWRSPAEYRQTDRKKKKKNRTGMTAESASGLTSHRGEARSAWHAVVALAHHTDTGCRERPAR